MTVDPAVLRRRRLFVVDVDTDTTKTFKNIEAAIGYATSECVHRPIGTRAQIRHRRLDGREDSWITVERAPARKVVLTLHFLRGEQTDG